jgi:predicted ester cyclase
MGGEALHPGRPGLKGNLATLKDILEATRDLGRSGGRPAQAETHDQEFADPDRRYHLVDDEAERRPPPRVCEEVITVCQRFSLRKGAEMSSIKETAEQFFEACETGKGWEACQTYCQEGATFSSQTGALAGIETLEGYTDWMKGLFTPVPDGSYEVRSFAVDDARQNIAVYGVFRGTHTGEGGPVPPTGKKVEADYVYVMDFEGGRVRHLTKIWNDGISLTQLGWA